jgi:hypothetical protein
MKSRLSRTGCVIALVMLLGAAPVAAQQAPSVHFDVYSSKPSHSLEFSGTGFAPNESVDVSLGDQALTTISADDEGRILHANVSIPLLNAGQYTVSFVGQTSKMPVSVGLNIDGVRPWVVLSNYYVSPQSGVGFNGEDFVPGETVTVYLNSTQSSPLAQVNADGEGRITMANAITPANLAGDNTLIFVGQQSQVQLTATFTVAAL